MNPTPDPTLCERCHERPKKSHSGSRYCVECALDVAMEHRRLYRRRKHIKIVVKPEMEAVA